jgi:hypothetical protein
MEFMQTYRQMNERKDRGEIELFIDPARPRLLWLIGY